MTHTGIREPDDSRRLTELIAAGEAVPGEPLDRPLEPLPVTGPITASEALERDRAES